MKSEITSVGDIMVDSAKKILQASVVEYIKRRHNRNYSQIAESINVHSSHIQKVSKGFRLLSKDKFDLLCERWTVDVDKLMQQMELDDQEYLKRESLLRMIKARKVNLEELSKKTGISILDLNHIERGKRSPTEKEIQKIAKVLDVEAQIIDEGLVAIVFEQIKKGLEFIHIEPSAIDAIIKFVEEEL